MSEEEIGYGESLRKWLRQRTSPSPWFKEPPKHCLFDWYRTIPERSQSRRATLPAFFMSGELRRVAAHPDGTVEIEHIPTEDECPVGPYEFHQATWNGFASELKDGSRDGYKYLQRQEREMWRDAKRLAERIDEAFKAENPKTEGPTNYIEETLRFRDFIKDKAADYEDLLRDVLPVTPQADLPGLPRRAFWMARNVFSAGHEILSPQESISISALGFDCGLQSVAADVTVKDALRLINVYLEGLRSQADDLGRTYALLTYRLGVLQSVLRDYNLYSEAEKITREEARQRVEDKVEPSNFQVDIEHLLSAMKDILKVSNKKRRVWHLEREGTPPNKTQVHNELLDYEGNPLEKKYGGVISRQRLGDIIDEHISQEELQQCRRKAGVGIGG